MTGSLQFYQQIKNGKEGNNLGLAVGSEKLKKLTGGLLPGTSYLIGGQSGSGKTTYMLWTYIYCPLIDFLLGNHPERDPYWILFSLEMTKVQIYAKLASMYLFDQFQEEVKYMEIFSIEEESMLTDYHESLLYDKRCQDFLSVLDERIICYEDSLNTKKYVERMDENLSRFGKISSDGEYIPNNPHQIIVTAIDHMSLIKGSNGRSKKEEMDLISGMSVQFRNKTRIISPVHVSLFNRNANSDERLKQAMQDPNSSDFKDSGALYEDSQVVLAVHSPHKYGVTSHHKYKVSILKEKYIGIFLLKSRFGNDSKLIPTAFYGDCSHYFELPPPDDIRDYEMYNSIAWTLQDEELVTQIQNNSKNHLSYRL